MKLRLIVAALLLLLAVPATASAQRFQGRAVGGSARGEVPKHNFSGGATFSLTFRDREQAGTRYRLCAIYRGRFRGCESGRTGEAGEWDRVASSEVYEIQGLGKITWRWSVDGSTVARWTTTIRREGEGY